MYLTRADWQAAAPTRALVPLDRSRVTWWTLHFDGSGPIGLRDPKLLMKAFQRYHQSTRGFADIAYNSAAFQGGDRAEGRGLYVGGHLLGAQNAIGWGCIAAIGDDEAPTDALLQALREDYDASCAWAGRTLQPRGHTEWPDANKACPGSHLLDWLHAGMPVAGPVVVPPLAVRTGLAVDGDFGPATKRALQRWLGVAADGIVGPATRKALQVRLGVRADGIWGPVTVRALQRLVGATADGQWGPNTTRALQVYLNGLAASL